MPYFTPHDVRRRRLNRLWVLTTLSACFLFLTLLDRRIFFALRLPHWEQWEIRDWEQALRTMGYIPMWVAVGVILLCATPRERHARLPNPAPLPLKSLAVAIPLAALLSGALAEACKYIFLRHRPSLVNGGGYLFDWVGGAYEGRGLGLASSHTAVAFGAAFILWRYSRPAGSVAMVLAAGCALTRLLAGAHFATDVYVAANLAWLGSGIVWNIARRVTESNRP